MEAVINSEGQTVCTSSFPIYCPSCVKVRVRNPQTLLLHIGKFRRNWYRKGCAFLRGVNERSFQKQLFTINTTNYKKKGKCLPQQAEVAQGVPGRLRPRIFLTFRHYKGGRSSAICTGRLYPRRNPWYSLSEAESTSGHMVLSGEPRKKSPVTPPGIDHGTVRLVAQCLNHYATPGPLCSTTY